MTETPVRREPVDPRDFTAADWNIITAVLRERARDLEWKATRPGMGLAAEKLQAAADRRRELAQRTVGAKIFCQDLRDNEVS